MVLFLARVEGRRSGLKPALECRPPLAGGTQARTNFARTIQRSTLRAHGWAFPHAGQNATLPAMGAPGRVTAHGGQARCTLGRVRWARAAAAGQE